MSRRVIRNRNPKVLAIGDPHFKSNNSAQTDALSDAAVSLIESEKYDAVVVLGDILDRHDRIDLIVLCRAMAFLKRIREASAAKLIIIIGNHDIPNNTTFCAKSHAFVACEMWPNTVVCDSPKEFTLGKRKCLGVPYIPTGRFSEAVPSLDGYDVIFAHQEFRGCSLSDTIKSSKGDVYPSDAPLCVSGHIHSYSRLQNNIIYPGSPFEHGWATTENTNTALFEFEIDGTYNPPFTRRSFECGRNRTVVFDSVKDFLASEVSADGHKTRIKVKCTRGEFAHEIAKSQKTSVLMSGGISVTPVITEEPLLEKKEGAFREILRKAFESSQPATKDFIKSALPNSGL